MKKILIITVAIVFAVSCSKKEDDSEPSKPSTSPACFETPIYSTQLPNMDFEEWGYFDSSGGKYLDPCGNVWFSSNGVSSQVDLITCDRTTDSQHGSYAVKMTTQSVLGPIIAPGVFFLGRFKSYEINLTKLLANAEFGVPFVEKPVSLKGYQKYTSVSSDSAFAAVMLSKYNTTTKTRDTVGYGELTIKGTSTAFIEFTINLDYSYSAGTETPDSLSMLFASSKEVEALEGQVGSSLIIDNLFLQY